MWTTACTELREHLFLMNVFTVESSDPIETTKKKEKLIKISYSVVWKSLRYLVSSCGNWTGSITGLSSSASFIFHYADKNQPSLLSLSIHSRIVPSFVHRSPCSPDDVAEPSSQGDNKVLWLFFFFLLVRNRSDKSAEVLTGWLPTPAIRVIPKNVYRYDNEHFIHIIYTYI